MRFQQWLLFYVHRRGRRAREGTKLSGVPSHTALYCILPPTKTPLYTAKFPTFYSGFNSKLAAFFRATHGILATVTAYAKRSQFGYSTYSTPNYHKANKSVVTSTSVAVDPP